MLSYYHKKVLLAPFYIINVNHNTKRTTNVRLEPSFAPLTKFMEDIIEKEVVGRV